MPFSSISILYPPSFLLLPFSTVFPGFRPFSCVPLYFLSDTEGIMKKIFQFVLDQNNYFFDELVLPERTGKPFEKEVTLRDVCLCVVATLIFLLIILGFVKLGKLSGAA